MEWPNGRPYSNTEITDLFQGRDVEQSDPLSQETYTENLDRVFHQALSEEDLNALDEPPPNPFETLARATFSNDDGKTATCNIRFKTSYLVYPDEPEPEPEEILPPVSPNRNPVLRQDEFLAPPGVTVTAWPGYFFNNAGTNLRFTNVRFNTTAYYKADETGMWDNTLFIAVPTVEELKALDPPPPNPFRIQVTMTVQNDEYQGTEATVDFVTEWIEAE